MEKPRKLIPAACVSDAQKMECTRLCLPGEKLDMMLKLLMIPACDPTLLEKISCKHIFSVFEHYTA